MSDFKGFLESQRFSLKTSQDIYSICTPLFECFEIHGFTFQRMYEDGGRIYLSSSEKWAKHFYSNNYFLASGFNKFSCLSKINLLRNWPQSDTIFHQLMADAFHNFNYDNGIVINRYNKNSLDAFTFRGYSYDDQVNNRYLSQLAVLEKFIDFFLIKAQKLVKQAKGQKLIIPEGKIKNEFFERTYNDNNKKQVFYKNIKANSLYYFDDKGGFFLPKRQSECVCLMACGYTTKEIASKLQISPRTVEVHINQVKYKLECHTKSVLLETLFKISWNRDILMRVFDNI